MTRQADSDRHPDLSWLISGTGCHDEYPPNPPRRVRKMLHLFESQRPAQDLPLPVGQPLLEDLVAAELVVPDCGGDVAPVGAVVEVNVNGGIAKGY